MLVPDLASALVSAESGYYRLILFVGSPESGKTSALRELADSSGFRLLSLSGPAAARLLELTGRQRQQRIAEIVTALVDEAGEAVILLDDIELLFEPSLAIDPLRLLQGLARNRTVVAAWPGIFADDAISYADAGHPEHRVYRNPEAIIVLLAAPHSTQT
jgi:ATPase family associated with various cellular activities (AAA)